MLNIRRHPAAIAARQARRAVVSNHVKKRHLKNKGITENMFDYTADKIEEKDIKTLSSFGDMFTECICLDFGHGWELRQP